MPSPNSPLANLDEKRSAKESAITTPPSSTSITIKAVNEDAKAVQLTDKQLTDLADDIFLDFSPNATDDFKKEFKELYKAYVMSGAARNYGGAIGASLISLLASITGAMEAAKADAKAKSIINYINMGVVAATGFCTGISQLFRSRQAKPLRAQIEKHPEYFNEKPTISPTSEALKGNSLFAVSKESKDDTASGKIIQLSDEQRRALHIESIYRRLHL